MVASYLTSDRYQEIVENQRRIISAIQRERDVKRPQEQIREDEQPTGKVAVVNEEASSSRPPRKRASLKRASLEITAPHQPLDSYRQGKEGGMSRRRISNFCCDCCDKNCIIGYTCGNEHATHTLCKGCVANYVQEWLFVCNSQHHVECSECQEAFTVKCQMPCFCSKEKCNSFLSVIDVTDILSAREVDHLKEKLRPQHSVSDAKIKNNQPEFAGQPAECYSKSGTARRQLSFERAQRHRFEELRNEAKLRASPSCAQELDKESVLAKGFDHFTGDQKENQSKKNKGLLWTKVQDDDSERERALLRDKIYCMAQELWNSRNVTKPQ